jgi:hypothetical protein
MISLWGINDDMVLINEGVVEVSEILLGPVVAGQLHRIHMLTRNFSGELSEERIKYFTAQDNPYAPGDVLGFNARGLGNMLRCLWDEVDTAVRYELRYGAASVAWEDATVISDTITLLEYSTRDVLPGTYDILLKAIDGFGVESTNAARVEDVILTANPDSYIVGEFQADHASSTLMTLVNNGTEWVTDSGETWNDLFPNAMNTYTNMIYSYQTVGACEYISEEFDTGLADFVGVWRVEPSARLLPGYPNGAQIPSTEQVAEVWDTAWNSQADLWGKYVGSKLRYRVNTTGKVFIVRLMTLLSVDIVPYVIRGTSTSSASAADQITWSPDIPDFIGFYSASITVSDGGGGFIGTYVFDPTPPYTYVDFYVWDVSDTQVAKDYSYEIRGA